VRQRFRKRVRAGEYVFHFAEHGAQALAVLEDNDDIDVVLTDINMPVMDGLALLARLDELDRVLKAVVISAYGDMENIRTAMNRGAFDFITKPIDFQDLEVTLAKTIEELRKLREGAEARERLIAMERELGVAARIQASILPRTFPAFPGRDDFDIHATMVPAREVGGDFYDFFLLDRDHLGFVIGDVAGKGIPGAIYMAVSRTIVRATALTRLAPDACLSHANGVLCCDNGSCVFVTLLYGTLDLRTGEVAYTNAGHNPPCILGPDGAVRELENQGGMVLGVVEGLQYPCSRVTLAPGETLFCYTDGVTDAMRADGAFFGADRLREVLENGASLAPAEVTNAVMEAVHDFTGGHPQHDDITLLALRYAGP